MSYITTVVLNEKIIKKVDEIYKRKGYKSRSAYIRKLIEDDIKKQLMHVKTNQYNSKGEEDANINM